MGRYFTFKMMGEDILVNKHSEVWAHTVMRIDNAEEKAKDSEDFKKRMVQRLLKMKHKDKIRCAIAYLTEKGYKEIVEIYEGKMLMDELTGF